MRATELFEALTGFADYAQEPGGFRRASKRIRLGLEALFYPLDEGLLGKPEMVRLREMSVGGISLVRRKMTAPPAGFVLRIEKPGVGLYWLRCTVRRHSPAGPDTSLVGSTIDSVLATETSLRPGAEVGDFVWEKVA